MRKNSVKVSSFIGDENKISRRPALKKSTKESSGFSTGVLSDITNIKRNDQLKKIKISKQTSNSNKSYSIFDHLQSTKLQKVKESTTDDVVFEDNDVMMIENSDWHTEVPDYEDIDREDSDDPLNVSAYVSDIFDHCFQIEESFMSNHNYMENQVEIQDRMRAILIDWLIEVHLKFTLLPETLYLAVNLIDRFLERVGVRKNQLQLVGMTCLFIASKYEEIYPPECNDFVYISANAYSREDIFEMEQKILNTLNFSLTAPTSLYFLRRFSKAARSDYKAHTLCKYILELCLLDIKMLKYKPSMIAASSVLLARIMMGIDELWNSTLQHYTKYEQCELYECVRDQASLIITNQNSKQAAFRKYSLGRFDSVALIKVPQENLP